MLPLRRFKTVLLVVLSLIASWTMIGCSGGLSDDPPRAVVSGKVTFQGEPVKFGNIAFIPEAGSELPTSGALIRDGQYTADQNGGVAVGKYRVEITAWSKPTEGEGSVGGGAADAVESDKNAQLIPEKYNTKTDLQLNVESTSPLQKDFNLN